MIRWSYYDRIMTWSRHHDRIMILPSWCDHDCIITLVSWSHHDARETKERDVAVVNEAAVTEETASTSASGSNASRGSITASASASSSASASTNTNGSNAISAGASSSASASNTTIRHVVMDKANANTGADEVNATNKEVNVSCTALPLPRPSLRAWCCSLSWW